MNREALVAHCLTYKDAVADWPFEGDSNTQVLRHAGNRKWFALLSERAGEQFVNLKCDTLRAVFWRDVFEGVTPGWHMNKRNWNTIRLESDVPDDILLDMIEESYRLTL